MKKTYIILPILILAVAAIVVVYPRVKNKTSQLPIVSKQSPKGSLKDLLAQKTPLKCSWKNDDKNSGTVYLKDGKYYGEVTVNGISGFIIMVDKCMWSWDGQGIYAVKSCFDKFPLEVESQDVQNGFPEATYNCESAEISDDKFNPPANITFKDLNITNPINP